MGSLNGSCDILTGQCPCKPGVTGRTCDQCQLDHYGYSDDGCTRKWHCNLLKGQTCAEEYDVIFRERACFDCSAFVLNHEDSV